MPVVLMADIIEAFFEKAMSSGQGSVSVARWGQIAFSFPPHYTVYLRSSAASPRTGVYAPYREHVPPDVTAAIFWLRNRDPAHWRDAWQVDHTLGKNIISDQPMSEEQWIKERATVIDVTSEK
jgi:hypothetical protein